MKKTTLLFILFAWSFIARAETGVLKGAVRDSATHEAIPFVVVAVEDSNANEFTAISNQLGSFKFANLHGGSYMLGISILGYKTVLIPIKVVENKSMPDLTIDLTRTNVSLTQVIVTSSTHDIGQTLNVINQVDMLLRPINTAQYLMRLVPGLFIAQHQGGGKAEQIFLRGFDADHGTDFAVFWDGIPVNMPSHAHGQGYADSHFMIPETIDQLNVYKGTYTTQYGDFATAGAASFSTKNFAENMVKAEYGDYGYNRIMGTMNLLGNEKHLLSKYKESAYISGENVYNAASYFSNPQDYHRWSIFGKYYGQLSGRTTLTVEGSYFQAIWNGSGQLPEHAITEGLAGRFGSLDPSEGGTTDRTNANVILKTVFKDGSVLKNQAFYSYYQLNLFTDFTFFLVDSVHGDGINQTDKGRNIFGYNGSYEMYGDIAGRDLKSVIGLTTKIDEGQLSLRHQEDRVILDTVSIGNLYEQNVSAYIDETYHLTNKFYINAGVRADYFYFQYKELNSTEPSTLTGSPEFGSGNAIKIKVSPKLNLYYNLNPNTQLFIRTGYGFHSNDARLVVENPSLNTLPTAFSYEIGGTFKPFDKMLVNAVLWGINLQNELTYDQDVAADAINGATQRLGADLSVRYQVAKILYFDLDLNYSHGRFIDSATGHNYIPLAPTLTSVAGITIKNAKG
ncbi:MAG TPA: TonB-dependent receptor plug domain-containing protein, partial [Bacteroidia bacterium]|nr:TonB-dependent receptor plug domain-containing protein [Bacteroidia bacterium]